MESIFLKLIVVLSIFGLFLFLFNKALRKWLNVEKRKFFSYGHVNEKHTKIDWAIRIVFIAMMIMGIFINITRDPLDRIWYLETYNLLFVCIFITEIVRVMMEKRYAENKNDYIFTAIQLVILAIFLLIVFSTDFFGLLNSEEFLY
ncbi:DUF4181 domain-containing protein [Lysinibacillus sp. SGAir0095]|uniref:DUF4181 domain-containing protein n=1 Tax=Lysinibacillus sp. SGAir0095 TaxID=2070463 RepID=UPI0010CD3389|nr:DUF4181 domain-containing protein [Lysinibacillus sp. SGAir0095]QCR33431.1 hypothetical protein C1N55_15305 [Lysinibacillus sp. SGAir0095]